MKREDHTGARFGSWTAVAIDRTDGHRTWWRVRCACGSEAVIRADSLKGSASRQCVSCAAGERSRTHGLTKTPTWKAWSSMRDRCVNPQTKGFGNYGGRGIAIDPRWEVFEQFLADMGERPSAGHSLDRIDPNGPYSPENCRWATSKEQNRNKRRTVFLEANGRRQSLAAWAEELGFSHITLYKRYAAGWSDERIINTPKLAPTCAKPRARRPHRPSTCSAE